MSDLKQKLNANGSNKKINDTTQNVLNQNNETNEIKQKEKSNKKTELLKKEYNLKKQETNKKKSETEIDLNIIANLSGVNKNKIIDQKNNRNCPKEKDNGKENENEKENVKDKDNDPNQEPKKGNQKENQIKKEKKIKKENGIEKDLEKKKQIKQENGKKKENEKEKEHDKDNEKNKEPKKQNQKENQIKKEKKIEKENEKMNGKEKEKEKEKMNEKEKEKEKEKKKEKEKQKQKEKEIEIEIEEEMEEEQAQEIEISLEDYKEKIKSIIKKQPNPEQISRKLKTLFPKGLNDELRKFIWPLLLDVPTDKLEPNFEKYIIQHKDTKQVRVDIERSLTKFIENIDPDKIPIIRNTLETIINSVLSKNQTLNYFQGIFCIFLIVKFYLFNLILIDPPRSKQVKNFPNN
ncbi:tbc1 domain family member 20 [Anaeramoeba flamelloides]|uniref:Tbc1 domain family member 20 n=1 Tax=Anaeramoeba flamelloides TaxID=1746091 RepID=A0ABQ8XTL1_9EUKA|nr:tbc1 domain family member 20 [Anaeramoeba flamelloides]